MSCVIQFETSTLFLILCVFGSYFRTLAASMFQIVCLFFQRECFQALFVDYRVHCMKRLFGNSLLA